MVLKGKQQRFVDEYLIDLNATQAAIRAGYSPKRAYAMGHENLKKPEVASAIQSAISERAARVEITQDMVLQRWWQIATVDVNDLVEYRRGPCPECYGGLPAQGVDRPDESCRQCKGEGHSHVHVHDSRELKGAARIVYNGVQVGRDGIKVLTLDRDKALENVARHLGMFVDRKEVTGKDGQPLIPTRPEEMTDEQLAVIAAAGSETPV